MLAFKKHLAATTVQQYMRGYIVVGRMLRNVQVDKMTNNFDYFSNLKGRLEYQATRTIKLFYLRWKLRTM